VDNNVRITLPGNTHPLARPEFDQGLAPADLPMKRMLLVLKRSPEQDSALLSLLDSQQDKRSPNYHKWLTPKEFGTRFGPSDSDVAAVTNWLKSTGFQVAEPSAGRTVIEFSGTASLVQAAFRTSMHKYVVNGKQHWANANDPEHNPLTFSLDSAPTGMTIDAITGVISWTPTAAQAGRNRVSLKVIDGQGGSATESFTIQVANS